MQRKLTIVAALSLIALSMQAGNIPVGSFRQVGPVNIKAPVQFDKTDVKGARFDVATILSQGADLTSLSTGTLFSGENLEAPAQGYSMGLLGFEIQNTRYFKGSLNLEKVPASHKVYVDGQEFGGDLILEPGDHKVVIKYVLEAGKPESVKISITVPDKQQDYVTIRDIAATDGRLYTVRTLLDSRRMAGVSVSPDGKYMIVSTSQRAPGQDKYYTKVIERVSGNVIREGQHFEWMPKSSLLYTTRKGNEGRELVTVNPATGKENVIAKGLPEGHFYFTESEDKLVFMLEQEGPKEREEIFEIITPDDRQPGWRDRSSVAIYDLKSHIMQPVSFGYNNVYISDISSDGKYALIEKSEARLTKRPTTVTSSYLLDLETFAIDTLVNRDGFVGGGTFSPDGKQVLYSGSPEAFDWIGAAVEEGQTPSLTEQELYILDLATKKVKPLTKDFDPCVGTTVWNKYDGKIYFMAENSDSVSIYRLTPADGKFEKLNLPEESIMGFSLAASAPVLAFYGEGATNSDRLYYTDIKTYGTKKQNITLVEDFNAKDLEGVTVGECNAWYFQNSLGEDVLCRYYLPVGFDASKKYPMIVTYYGGCLPTGRNLESNYPPETWSALGYVALVVQPSGATGFGQKWSARHVNTAGTDPARDIIEAVKTFCGTHDFVLADKVGCVGASYGGFMTQYLQTVTDIFACAISHAGISDHTSYWGYGYWGYSYSETSMANSYPWTRKDLFVDHSPLYNADKVHTPLLFLHGTVDTNVPYNESVQMYTALKLLGRETAFVSVLDQNHHIDDYMKHIWWHNTQMAWFAKYLQGDDTWWEAQYPHKDL